MVKTQSAPTAASTPACKLLTPQISWHGKDPVYSIDVSNSNGFVATGGADNEVRLWRLRLAKEASEAVCFVQELSGHSKVCARAHPPACHRRPRRVAPTLG